MPMSETKTRRLTRDYLAAVNKVLLALDRAKELREALRRHDIVLANIIEKEVSLCRVNLKNTRQP